MKKLSSRWLAAAIAIVATAWGAHAQYYQIANQISSLVSPALSGSVNYKGYVEASGLAGFGDNHANFVGISTSQGFTYGGFFFMGAGMGLDMAIVPDYDDAENGWNGNPPDYYGHSASKNKAMIPVFTDFRLFSGGGGGAGFYLGVKVGATWLLGDRYLSLQHGRLTGQTQFYLKPSLGLRIPASRTNPKQAVNVGVTYQLITSNSNYYRWDGDDVTLSAVGLSISFEW